MEKLNLKSISSNVKKDILAFLNKAKSAEDITSSPSLQDDPNKGYGDQRFDYTIGKTVAQRILEVRDKLPKKKFTDLEQLNEVKGLGQDKLDDLVYSFKLPESSVPELNKFIQEVYSKKRPGSLVLAANEHVTLSADSNDFKQFYQRVSLTSASRAKNFIGIQNQYAQFAGSRSLRALPRYYPVENLKAADPEVRQEAVGFARELANAFIYGDSKVVAHYEPYINQYLELFEAVAFIPIFQDIIVNNGAVLTIARNTYSLIARRIKMYGTGTIRCEGPTTFTSLSVAGSLPTITLVGGDFVAVARQ